MSKTEDLTSSFTPYVPSFAKCKIEYMVRNNIKIHSKYSIFKKMLKISNALDLNFIPNSTSEHSHFLRSEISSFIVSFVTLHRIIQLCLLPQKVAEPNSSQKIHISFFRFLPFFLLTVFLKVNFSLKIHSPGGASKMSF